MSERKSQQVESLKFTINGMSDEERRQMRHASLRGHIETLAGRRDMWDTPDSFAYWQETFRLAGAGQSANENAAVVDGLAAVAGAFMDGVTLEDLTE